MTGGLQVQVFGADELAAALQELPRRATQRAVVLRGLVQAAEPIRGVASALAPYDEHDAAPHLRDVIVIGTKTTSRKGNPYAVAGDVTVYIGPARTAGHQHAVEMEVGTFKDRPQPYMRPAWESEKQRSLTDLGFYLWSQIDATAIRLAKRAA